MKRILITLCVLIFTLATHAQNLDSLWNIWNDKTQPDTMRIKAIDKIAWDGYLFSLPDSAFYFAQMQYDLAKKNNLKKSMAGALNIQGVSFVIRSDYSKALEYYKRSLKIKEEISDKNGIAGSLNNIGIIYKIEGDYPKALDYYQRSLKIENELGDKNGIAISLSSIGTIYNEQGNSLKALEYYKKSLNIIRDIDDKSGMANALNNIGSIYQDQGDYLKALDHYERSLEIMKEIGDRNGKAISLNNIGGIYGIKGDYSKALEHYKKSLKIEEEIGDKNGIAYSLNSIGRLYYDQGDHQKSINQCEKSLLMAKEIGSVSLQSVACQCLYNAYKKLGKGNKALAYHEQMIVLDDSLNAEETNQQLQRMEFAKQVLEDSLATAEKERTVLEAHREEVRQEKQSRNILGGVGVLVLILAGGLYGRVRFIRKSKATLQKEKDRSENLLLNILPADIAAELKEKGKADARDFDKVSILFTDFKGFTKASEKLSAQELVSEINTCFEAFDGIIEKYGIEKIKTIGDAYMAAGGLPVPTDDSVKNTVLAALEMQAFIGQRKREMDSYSKPAFEMRVGIHTGPVVAGIVGVKKFQYDIWGDTVNTASRMESSGAIGKVNISQATYEMLKDDSGFTFEIRGKIEAKGKGELEMYFASMA